MTKRLLAGVVGVAALTAVAAAQFANPDDAVNYRKAVMVMIGHHFKSMGAVVKSACW